MAEARHGIRITEPLNQVMRKVYDSGHGLTDAGLATLGDSVVPSTMWSPISTSPPRIFVDQPSLLRRLHELETEVDAELARASVDGSSSAIVAQLPEVRRHSSAAEHVASSTACRPHRRRGCGRSVRSRDRDDLQRRGHRAARGRRRFADAWNLDRKDKDRVAELQRQLHTLKGGARMAGITAMGNLSHELETLVIKIDTGAVPADDHAHAVMQASLDELARMRDMVSAVRCLPPAPRCSHKFVIWRWASPRRHRRHRPPAAPPTEALPSSRRPPSRREAQRSKRGGAT
jgi:hypothetical protein